MLHMSPYLVFNGTAAEALEFYRSVFGGELTTMPHSQFNSAPELAGQLMHGQLTTEGFVLMAADDPSGGSPSAVGNTTICVWGDDLTTGQRWFEALAVGGTVGTAFAQQMWGDAYGDLVDRYGVAWGINVTPGSD